MAFPLRSALAASLLLGLLPGPGQAQTWQRCYGGHGLETGRAVRQAADGGFIICGSAGSFGAGGGDIYLLKVDGDGERQWSRTLGGAGVDQADALAVLPDGGYVLAGSSNSYGAGYDGYIARTDAAGELLWEHTIGGPDWDFLHAVEPLDDGLLFAGQTYDTGGGDLWLVRTDLAGEVLWTRTYGTEDVDEARAVRATADGGCALAGTFGSTEGHGIAVVVKVDASGDEEWTALLDEATDQAAMGLDIAQDGGYVVGGHCEQDGAGRRMMLARVDADGTVPWQRSIGDGGTWTGREVRELPSGGIALVGETDAFGGGGTDIYLLQTDADGFFTGGPTFGGTADEEGWSFDLVEGGGYILVGSSRSYGPGYSSVFAVRTDGNVLSDPVIVDLDPLPVEEATDASALPVFPVPVKRGAELSFDADIDGPWTAEIKDMQGRTLATSYGTLPKRIGVPDLPAGAYLLVVTTRNARTLRSRIVVN